MENAQAAPTPARRNRRVLIYLIVATTVLGLSLYPASMAVIVSPLMFDSGESPKVWTQVLLIWSYPVLVLLGLLAAWILFAARAYGKAITVSLLPLLAAAVVLLALFAWK